MIRTANATLPNAELSQYGRRVDHQTSGLTNAACDPGARKSGLTAGSGRLFEKRRPLPAAFSNGYTLPSMMCSLKCQLRQKSRKLFVELFGLFDHQRMAAFFEENELRLLASQRHSGPWSGLARNPISERRDAALRFRDVRAQQGPSGSARDPRMPQVRRCIRGAGEAENGVRQEHPRAKIRPISSLFQVTSAHKNGVPRVYR